MPYALLAVVWFLVTALFPGPAMLVAVVIATIGLVAGVTRYRHDPVAPLPALVYVGGALLAGSAALLQIALIVV